MSPVLAAQSWRTNSDMILSMVELGYLQKDWVTADVTWGKGNWWNKWKPTILHAYDIEPSDSHVIKQDFTTLHESLPPNSYDAVAFDPPYVAQGGRSTSTTQEFLQRYGLVDVPTTLQGTTALILRGLASIRDILKPNGLVLMKGMNYVTSGSYATPAYDVLQAARASGYSLADEFIHVRQPGPQPKRKKQYHARRNYSMLFVLQKET